MSVINKAMVNHVTHILQLYKMDCMEEEDAVLKLLSVIDPDSRLQLAARKLGFIDVVMVVASEYGIPVESILSERQYRPFVEPRQICMYFMHEMFFAPGNRVDDKIGEFFKRDRATVINARGVVADLMDVTPDYQTRVLKIKDQIIARIEDFN